MTATPDVGIVGAGFAGLAAAKVLRAAGCRVTVYEAAPDVGGVWSATRRYPGLRTQNTKQTYGFSDFPMPADYPEFPSGAQVQTYLQAYVDHFELGDVLRLSTTVELAEPRARGGWALSLSGGDRAEHDHLVAANGIFCDPLVPEYPGADAFRDAGGRLLAVSELHAIDEVAGREVLVVGYGKSACDIADAVSDRAASTTVIARRLLWKMPRKLGNVVPYKFLMLTRMGEALFRYIAPTGVERFLHGPGNPIRRQMLGSVQWVIGRQHALAKLELVPGGTFEDIARSTVSLSTEGFYEKVRDGEIAVRRDMAIERLLVHDGRPHAQLADGTMLPADFVVCGTGFRQSVSFLPAETQAALQDERGNFMLFRQIRPLRVPDLSFCGYNSSFFSPLSAEVAAWWIATDLMAGLDLPPAAEQEAHVRERLAWMEERTQGKHARGTNIIPFSMHNVDEMLGDLGVDVSGPTKARQWLLPIDPGSYAKVARRALDRVPAPA